MQLTKFVDRFGEDVYVCAFLYVHNDVNLCAPFVVVFNAKKKPP